MKTNSSKIDSSLEVVPTPPYNKEFSDQLPSASTLTLPQLKGRKKRQKDSPGWKRAFGRRGRKMDLKKMEGLKIHFP